MMRATRATATVVATVGLLVGGSGMAAAGSVFDLLPQPEVCPNGSISLDGQCGDPVVDSGLLKALACILQRHHCP